MFSTTLRTLLWLVAGLGLAATIVAANTPQSPSGTAGVPLSAAVLQPATPVQPAARQEDNPRVPAGLVKWHASFTDAQKAAQQSGKPVLLFHMMGQLDRQFC